MKEGMLMIFRNIRRDQGGFSLLEVLISIGLFSGAILGVIIMLLSTIRGNSVSMHLSGATQLASKQIEELMLMNYADLRDTDHDGVNGLDDRPASRADMARSNVKTGGIAKTYQIFINVAEDWPVNGTKTIRVIVAWEDGGRDKQTEFEFMRTQGE